VYFYFPETSGVPLEEVARLFGDEVAVTLEDAGQKTFADDLNQDESAGSNVSNKQAVDKVETIEKS
jgi:hypothetical protein